MAIQVKSREQKHKGTPFKGDPKEHAKIIYDSLREAGATHASSMAILGNIRQETGDFKYVEEIVPNKHKDYGLGILQWSQERGTAFRKWLAANNKDVSSIKDNVEYLLEEIKRPGGKGGGWSGGMTWDAFSKLENIQEATEVFADTYLRPSKDASGKRSGLKERLSYALTPMRASTKATYTDPTILNQERDIIPQRKEVFNMASRC